jgi:hypothetical protein
VLWYKNLYRNLDVFEDIIFKSSNSSVHESINHIAASGFWKQEKCFVERFVISMTFEEICLEYKRVEGKVGLFRIRYNPKVMVLPCQGFI